eukprot:6466627-Amphidinium_carterae.1
MACDNVWVAQPSKVRCDWHASASCDLAATRPKAINSSTRQTGGISTASRSMHGQGWHLCGCTGIASIEQTLKLDITLMSMTRVAPKRVPSRILLQCSTERYLGSPIPELKAHGLHVLLQSSRLHMLSA